MLSRILRMLNWMKYWSKGLKSNAHSEFRGPESHVSYYKNRNDRFSNFVSGRAVGPGLHKWSHYIDYYDSRLSTTKPVTVLEIGIQSGGSLDMWDSVLPDGSIVVGIDINGECKRSERDRIKVEIGSQADTKFLNKIGEKYGPFDLVIDDGSHVPDHQVTTLLEMMKFVKPGGLYIVEDIHCRDNTFAAFMCGLVSQLNEFRPEPNLIDCHTNNVQKSFASVTFGPFFCAIEVLSEPLGKITNFKSGNDWISY